ncbi:hypothetical protein ABG768_010643 [Culter alburnus]|uniref:Uncharacterized protein n=1 Tax=Culter alburnus TaxID=194366 RepID=A0AAW1ZAY1_CULAL
MACGSRGDNENLIQKDCPHSPLCAFLTVSCGNAVTSITIFISPDSISAAADSRISASFAAAATSFLCCRDNSSDSSPHAHALVAAILAVDDLELLKEVDINDLVSS